MFESVHQRGLFLRWCEESDDSDDTLQLDGLERLFKAPSATDLENVVESSAFRSQSSGNLTPIRGLFVVYNVGGSWLL